VLSSGIFCHSGSQGKREKTAAREVLVESILTQVNLTGNLITKVVIFEYDNPADSLEANRRWEETKALLQAAVLQLVLSPRPAAAGAAAGECRGEMQVDDLCGEVFHKRNCHSPTLSGRLGQKGEGRRMAKRCRVIKGLWREARRAKTRDRK
jgi:hypothetical protein